jgi:hypothetical protein
VDCGPFQLNENPPDAGSSGLSQCRSKTRRFAQKHRVSSTGFGLSKIGKWLPLDEKPCPEASVSEAGKVLIKRQSGAPWARAHPDAYHQIWRSQYGPVRSGYLPHPSAVHCHLVSIGSGAIGGRRRPLQRAGLQGRFSGRDQLRYKRGISPRTASMRQR